ncbi:F0F1-ATPase subunit [Methylocaldum marinum]|uniref:F0F1-ATPase subunit n=1 Tax=Methylocaldum marinum TaxID=1432792 RepID=A0A250KLT3_9GAMM|nr:AtpZ/AtpI family protein [Methylocaldum marinum]BBA32690.1 F0F1-ATPase subunit [Methylocaldum marinum]
MVDDERRRRRDHEESLGDMVERKAARRMRKLREDERPVWFWFGMFGLVGWTVAIPTLIGVAIGIWLDRAFPGKVSWTLNLLIVGVILGCINAWYWVKKELHRD